MCYVYVMYNVFCVSNAKDEFLCQETMNATPIQSKCSLFLQFLVIELFNRPCFIFILLEFIFNQIVTLLFPNNISI